MGGIWGDKAMGPIDALLVSLSGMATVFFALILLALAIIIMGKVLNAMGLGANAADKKPTVSASSGATSAATAAPIAKPAEENTEEIAVVLAAISEHTRTPIENLKINSITKK